MPPDRRVSGGFLDQSARENTTVTSLKSFRGRFGLRRKREVAEVRRWFSDLSVSPPHGLENLLSTFSGGNQQKILFAKWLRLQPSLFLLDEPTQGVDVGAKALLHHQLLEAASAGMSVVVQSSDVDELAVLCERLEDVCRKLNHGRTSAIDILFSFPENSEKEFIFGSATLF